MPTVWVLLPALNEQEGIRTTIQQIPKDAINSLGFEIRVLVVDGRSSDLTVQASLDEGAEVIVQHGPKGKGTGVREAFEYLIEKSADNDLVCMMDADGTYPPGLIPEVCKYLEEYQVVMGSRLRGKISEGSMSRINYLGNYLLSMFASMINLKRTTDVCTGLWGFRAEILQEILPNSKGFTVEAELFSRISRIGLKIKEIPADYSNRDGESHLVWYLDGPKIFFSLLSMRFQRLGR